jgi:hypothetical protein
MKTIALEEMGKEQVKVGAGAGRASAWCGIPNSADTSAVSSPAASCVGLAGSSAAACVSAGEWEWGSAAKGGCRNGSGREGSAHQSQSAGEGSGDGKYGDGAHANGQSGLLSPALR